MELYTQTTTTEIIQDPPRIPSYLPPTIESHLLDYFRITTIPRGLRQRMLGRASAKGDEVPSPNAERCVVPSEARLAHNESVDH